MFFFSRFRPNPYTRMCVSTIGSYSTLGKIVKKHGKTQVESWVLGFSLIFDFSVYLKNSSRITFPPSGGGPCSRSLRCSKEQGGRPGGRAVRANTGPGTKSQGPRSCWTGAWGGMALGRGGGIYIVIYIYIYPNIQEISVML